jgi:hypothetical protein
MLSETSNGSTVGRDCTVVSLQMLQAMRRAGVYTFSCESFRLTANDVIIFQSYNMLKKQAAGGDTRRTLSAGQYLICSAEASLCYFLAAHR